MPFERRSNFKFSKFSTSHNDTKQLVITYTVRVQIDCLPYTDNYLTLKANHRQMTK